MRAERYVTAESLEESAVGWLAGAGGSRLRLEPDKCALLVVDVQRFFAHPDGASHLPVAEAVVPGILSLLRVWRGLNLPLAFTRHCHRAGEERGALLNFWGSTIGCEDPDSALLPELGRRNGEPVFRKTTYDAFRGTGLERWLGDSGCGQLLAVGFLTHLCVETTVRSAFTRDLEPFVVVDATATVTEAMHACSLRAMAHGFAGLLDVRGVREILDEARG